MNLISKCFRCNVRPQIARRTPSRDEPIIQTFEVSLSQVYEDIAGKGLFHSYFSSQTPVCNENYRGISYTITRSVNTINYRFSYTPLLNHDQLHIYDFWNHSIIVLIRKNLALSFKYIFRSLAVRRRIIIASRLKAIFQRILAYISLQLNTVFFDIIQSYSLFYIASRMIIAYRSRFLEAFIRSYVPIFFVPSAAII